MTTATIEAGPRTATETTAEHLKRIQKQRGTTLNECSILLHTLEMTLPTYTEDSTREHAMARKLSKIARDAIDELKRFFPNA